MIKGSKALEISKQRMRLKKLGKPSNFKGHKHTQEAKEKISKAKTGENHSAERRIKNRLAQIRRYKAINPNYRVASRNSRIIENGGFHSNGEWETLKAQYNWTCPCCRKSEPGIKLTKDHIVPLLKGGSNNIENIQPLCKLCNSKKHTKTVKY